MGETIQTPNPGAASGTPPPAVNQDWTASLPDDLKAFQATKQFKDPGTVLQSYMQLEKTIGVPPERLFKLPEKSDDPEWQKIYNRLGRPEKPDGYNIPLPKEGGDEKFATWAKSAFHELGLTATQAQKLAEKWNGFAQEAQGTSQTEHNTKIQGEETALKKEWGAAYDQNLDLAHQAAEKYGLTKETITKLKDVIGFSEMTKIFHKIATEIQPDRFISGANGGKTVLTPGSAKAALDAKMKDQAWIDRWQKGDIAAREEWDSLNKALVASN